MDRCSHYNLMWSSLSVIYEQHIVSFSSFTSHNKMSKCRIWSNLSPVASKFEVRPVEQKQLIFSGQQLLFLRLRRFFVLPVIACRVIINSSQLNYFEKICTKTVIGRKKKNQREKWSLPANLNYLFKLTFELTLDTILLPGKENNFSTPPVSFQCINFFVGGAKSNVEMMSDVSDNCNFIVSPGNPFCSSTISLRFLLFLPSVPVLLYNKIIHKHFLKNLSDVEHK